MDMTDELRTLLDEAFYALEHDKSAIAEKLERIWRCKPSCLKCRIGVALATKTTSLHTNSRNVRVPDPDIDDGA